MKIVRLVEADWEAYRAIRLEALHMAPEAFGSDWEEQLGRPPEHWASRLAAGGDSFDLAAIVDERIVGTAGFLRESGRKTRHKGMIRGVYVSPAYRGRGIARELMTALLDEARGLPGLEQVILSVVTENHAARDLYRKLGFVVYGSELRALKVGGRYLDEDHMVLFLGEQ